MRYLICGDIHGNLPALQLLLKKENGNYDVFVSHGDVVNFGPWSNECVELLNELPNKLLLKGNHESYFINGAYPGTNAIAKLFFNHCYPSFNRFKEINAYKEGDFCGIYSVQHTIYDNYVFENSVVCIKNNFIIGHTHHQFINYQNAFHIVNTGSVGQNRKFINEVNYIMYNDANNSLQLMGFLYDPQLIINEFKARNFPEPCIAYYSNKPFKQPL